MYKVVTEIDGEIVNSRLFDGEVDIAMTTTTKPRKHYDYDYYYFIIDGSPRKVFKDSVMIIRSFNVS